MRDILEVQDRLAELFAEKRISMTGWQRSLRRTWPRMSEADRAREVQRIRERYERPTDRTVI